jgi:hypothetical protein
LLRQQERLGCHRIRKISFNHRVERKRPADQNLNRSLDMVWRVTNQNAAGQRIGHNFFDTRFARECHLNSACQPLIPF